MPYSKIRNGNCKCPICKQNNYYNINDAPTKKSGYRILALDQATITSGWSVFDNEQLIKYGQHTSEGKNSVDKVAATKQWFVSMINSWKPDSVILEDIQLQKTNQGGDAVLTYKKLAQLLGVLENYLYETKIAYKIVPPATWRALSNIKGKNRTEKKRCAQLIVKQQYDISVSQDEADAILIGVWGAHQHKKNDIIIF